MSCVPTSMMPIESSTFASNWPMTNMMPFNMPSYMPHPTMPSMPSMPMPSWPMMNTMPMPSWPMMNTMPSWPMMNTMSMPSMTPMTPFFGESMPSMTPMTPFFGESMTSMNPMTPFFGESMTSMNPMTTSFFAMYAMNPMNKWMRNQLPREIRDVAFRPTNVLEYTTLVNPIVYHADGSRMLTLCFEVKGFKPEEIKIEVLAKERAIVVEAKTEVKEKEHTATRTYSRKFVLPENVNVDLAKVELKSVLTHDGLLVIESALPRITPEELKAIREKAPSKTTPYMPTGPILPTGHHAISIPVKMN